MSSLAKAGAQFAKENPTFTLAAVSALSDRFSNRNLNNQQQNQQIQGNNVESVGSGFTKSPEYRNSLLAFLVLTAVCTIIQIILCIYALSSQQPGNDDPNKTNILASLGFNLVFYILFLVLIIVIKIKPHNVGTGAIGGVVLLYLLILIICIAGAAKSNYSNHGFYVVNMTNIPFFTFSSIYLLLQIISISN
jgi:hypothetical protein